MKKLFVLATCLLFGACYTPINNSGISTNKPWLDVSGTRLDFDGQQYDSCIKFNIHFWPPEAAERINLIHSCISACCWRSEQNEIVLDFNKDFEKELAQKGRARKYTPEKVTLKVTHSNFANYTKVTVTPHGAITNKGLLKLAYEEVDDPVRLAQLQHQTIVKPAAFVPPETVPAQPRTQGTQKTVVKAKTSPATGAASVAPKTTQTTPIVTTKNKVSAEAEKAKTLLTQQMGAQIDTYFYQMNKTYRNQGAIFILSDRLLQSSTFGDGIYLLTCHAKARTGLDSAQLNASDFPCGKWLVNIQTEVVAPYDAKARSIKNL